MLQIPLTFLFPVQREVAGFLTKFEWKANSHAVLLFEYLYLTNNIICAPIKLEGGLGSHIPMQSRQESPPTYN